MWSFAQLFVVVPNMLGKDSLEEQKKNRVQNDRLLKRKQVREEITAVNKKKAMLETTIRELTNDAPKYAMDAENVSKLEHMKTFLSKSNPFQKTAKEKMKN